MLTVICFLFVFLVHFENGMVNASSKIHPQITTLLNKGEKVSVLVLFKDGIKSTVESARTRKAAGGDRGALITSFVNELKKTAESSQEGVAKVLSSRSGGHKYFRKFWSSNKMFVKEADAETIKKIADDPQVTRIMKEPIFKVPTLEINGSSKGRPPIPVGPQTRDSSICLLPEGGNPGWHRLRNRVSECWEELGNRGDGVIVATIDTGIRHTHESLRHNFRGDYGWYDGVNMTLEPVDLNGHGTGTMDLLAGTGWGIAPGATWMSCRGCGDDKEGEECRIEHLLNCIQFILCPTLADGSNPDCSKAPHVLSYSISGERDTAPLDDDFLTLKSAGIIPVAGIGNDGPKCPGVSGSPANAPWVIGVGGHTYCDRHSRLSSTGPAPDGTIKPDIVAPCNYIAHATSASDNAYVITHGTSNATPIVAGVVALLHVRNPDLTFEEAYDFLIKTVDKDITPFYGYNCSYKENFTYVPNNFFGYGRLDGYEAIKAQTVALKRKGGV